MANPENILEGPARMFIGNSAYHASPDSLPADTVAFGAAWGGAWRDVGYTTEEGVNVSFGAESAEIRSAQVRHPVYRMRTGYTDTIGATLLEATLQNIKDATGRGTITVVAPSGPTPGHDELRLTDDPTVRYVAVGFEGVAPPNDKANPRRIIFPAVMATATVALANRIGAATGVPAEFTRVGGTESEPLIRDVTTS